MFNNQDLLQLVIISFVLVRFKMFDSWAIFLKEIRCNSLLGVNPLTTRQYLYIIQPTGKKNSQTYQEEVCYLELTPNSHNFLTRKWVPVRGEN